ncbi:MAG: hypothetical protein ACO1QR_14115 [Chthoniobacteraceae bacterium]
MNAGSLRSVALVTSCAILLSSCAELTPGESAAVFGGFSGVAAGGIARAAGMSTAESIATGAAVGAVVAVTTYIIAKHQATERQRQIAERRARAAYERMLAQREAAAAREEAAAERRAASRRTASKPKPKAKSKTQTRAAAKKKLPRYIAVDTEKDERTSPQAKKAVMIFDTQAEQIVGNNVYDVQSTPTVGSTARFETYSAQYVGTGS